MPIPQFKPKNGMVDVTNLSRPFPDPFPLLQFSLSCPLSESLCPHNLYDQPELMELDCWASTHPCKFTLGLARHGLLPSGTERWEWVKKGRALHTRMVKPWFDTFACQVLRGWRTERGKLMRWVRVVTDCHSSPTNCLAPLLLVDHLHFTIVLTTS